MMFDSILFYQESNLLQKVGSGTYYLLYAQVVLTHFINYFTT